MRSQSLAVNYAPEAREGFGTAATRLATRGGLVGEMLKQIEEHMTAPAPAIGIEAALVQRVDPIHILSMIAGYVGLACGFGAAVFVVSWLF